MDEQVEDQEMQAAWLFCGTAKCVFVQSMFVVQELLELTILICVQNQHHILLLWIAIKSMVDSQVLFYPSSSVACRASFHIAQLVGYGLSNISVGLDSNRLILPRALDDVRPILHGP